MPTVTIGDNTGDDYAGTIDTFLQEAAPTSDGGDLDIVVRSDSGARRHGLIAFPGISNLPAAIAVSAATMNLYLSTAWDTDPKTNDANRVLVSWDEAATWNTTDGSTSWNTAGCLGSGTDRASASSGSTSTDQTTGAYKALFGSTAQFRTDIENFASGVFSNYGWVLTRTDAVDTSGQIFNTELRTDGQRPYLSVTYTETGGSSQWVTLQHLGRGFGPHKAVQLGGAID